MKRKIIFFIMLACTTFVFAAPPQIPVLKAFDGRYNNEKNVTIIESIKPSQYYYSIEVQKKPEIIKEIVQLFEESEKNAESTNKRIQGGYESTTTYVLSSGDTKITMGCTVYLDNALLRVYVNSNVPLTIPKMTIYLKKNKDNIIEGEFKRK